MNLSLFAGSAFHRKYANELKAAGLEFAPVADCFASVFPDGRWFGVSTDLEKTVARLAAFSAEDAETWRRLVGGFMGEAEHLFRLLGSPMSGRALAGTGWNLWRKKGVKGALDIGKLLLSSPRAWLDETFSSPHVKATLAAWGMHLDFAPDIAGGAVFPYLESMANQSFGMVLGKGGADTMIRALEKMVISAGGKIFTGADVAEIMTSGGRATGVRLASGEAHTATKAVIAGVAPGALAGRLLPNGSGDAGFDTAMKKFRHAPGTMMIHLALDDLPDWSAGDGAEEIRLCPHRAVARPDGKNLSAGRRGPPAGRAGAGGRPADRNRSLARARRQACPVGAGARAARRDRGRRGGRDRAGVLG